MNVKSLIPWGRERNLVPAAAVAPMFALDHGVNRLFDDFFREFDAPFPNGASSWPTIEIIENDKDIKVSADLPGLEESDIDITLRDGILTLKGEKKHESKGAVYSERWHGRFVRAIEVGAEVDPDKVEATFDKGVLTVSLTKRPEALSQVKRIAINARH